MVYVKVRDSAISSDELDKLYQLEAGEKTVEVWWSGLLVGIFGAIFFGMGLVFLDMRIIDFVHLNI